MVTKRRSLQQLTQAVEQAQSNEQKGLAHYHLAVFHDNNSREAEAIPHYERALELGLDPQIRAEALAWLASSLWKTGRPNEASARTREAEALTEDPQLRSFLRGLRRRIDAGSRAGPR